MGLLQKLYALIAPKPYISQIDKFLDELRKIYPKKSASQRAEIAKYQRIFALRGPAIVKTAHNS